MLTENLAGPGQFDALRSLRALNVCARDEHVDSLADLSPRLGMSQDFRVSLRNGVGNVRRGIHGWPPLRDILSRSIALRIPIHVGTACSRARGVLQSDLEGKSAEFATPTTLVQLLEWSDKVLSE